MVRRTSSATYSRTGAKTEVIATFTQTSIGPSSILDQRGGAVDLRRVRHVGRHREHPSAAALTDVRRGSVEALGRTSEQRNVVPALRERACRGAPHTERSTGHDDDSATHVRRDTRPGREEKRDQARLDRAPRG